MCKGRMWYRILDDVDFPNRWHLDTVLPSDGDEWAFWSLLSSDPNETKSGWKVAIQYPGKLMDFTFSGFDVPVLSKRTKAQLLSICHGEIELIPIKVEGTSEPFYILRVLKEIKCVDEIKSDFMKWQEHNGRPDKIGEYRMFTQLILDPNKIPKGVNIFRLVGWQVALICSEKVRSRLGDITGIKYENVT